MKIEYATLDTCSTARDVVVVIDVCRAFTTAAYAFGSGAERILLAGTVEEALALRARFPGALAMGEVDGLPVAGFDFWNSPVQLSMANLAGKTLVQRTSAGTQGIVRAREAETLLAGSFSVAGATVRAIQKLGPQTVTFVITGSTANDSRYGMEDRACADYMGAMLQKKNPDWHDFMHWEDSFRTVHHLDDLPASLRTQFEADLLLCKFVDRYSWALKIDREGDLLVMKKIFKR
jgi:2-phosphosulfolactate phosphatase